MNMFGVEETLCWVSWFVFLYIWAMIVMPLFGRIIDRKPYIGSAILIFISYPALVLIHYFVSNFGSNHIWYVLFVDFSWMPTIVLGYLFARKGLFQKMSIPNHKIIPFIATGIVLLVLWLKSIFSGIKIFNFDIFYATIIIGCILIVFSQNKLKYSSIILSELGDKSVYMWFIHALFFTAATRNVYQQFVMVSDNLWIIAIWTIALSYLVSIPIKRIMEL